MWMNLWEQQQVELTGKEAGVFLRVDDSNDRGSSRDGHPRSRQGAKGPSRSLSDVICALLGACRRPANHRLPCCDFIRRVTLDRLDDTHKAKPHG